MVDKKKSFLLHVVAEYIDAPDAFLERWHSSSRRREMLHQLTSTYGYDHDQLATLIDEDLGGLQALAAKLGGEVGGSLPTQPRYPGNKVYIESVTPGHARANATVHVAAVVWCKGPADVYLLSDLGKKVQLTSKGHGDRQVYAADAQLDRGVWSVEATFGAATETFTNAIQVG